MENNDLGTPLSLAAPGPPAGYDPGTGVMPPSDMTDVGNIDVNHRPVIWNDDGTPSTIYSATIPVAGGKWALIPTIADGKFMTLDGKIPKEGDKEAFQKLEDAAAERYAKTGEHLGKFKSQKAADDYATATHAFMPNGGPEKVFISHYEGESNMPLTRKEYEAEIAKRASRKNFSDLGGRQVKSKPLDFSDLGGKRVDK